MTNHTMGLRVKVAAKRMEAPEVYSFELVAEGGASLPAFSAGSHIDVALPGGLTRQYSLCNDPSENHRYLIAVLRDPRSRGGSAMMHDMIQAGDSIAVSAPKNHFALDDKAKKSLLLAGGIGITPILCMAERLQALGADFELHYCTRSKERTAFLGRIAASTYSARVKFHFDDGEVSQKLDFASVLSTPEAGSHLYVCGPQGFMEAVLRAARAQGWAESQLHYEFFAGDAAPRANDGSFELQLAGSGRVILVPADKTVVQALEDADVCVPVSCGEGVCGTCVTRVVDGVPDHRDVYLTAEEKASNSQFMPCCSRSRTPRLVVDL